MEAFDLSRVLELLRSIYPLVQTLEEFAESLQFKEGRKATLVEASDSELYRTFTRTLVVCRDGVLRQTPSCAQVRARALSRAGPAGVTEQGREAEGWIARWGTAAKEEKVPAWRSGTFPPPRPSSCFIRILGLLYSEQGFKSFLLNRKLKGRVDGPRRLRGRDMVKLVFFEGLAYLNGVEKKPKKLPKRFHQMEDIFTQLLRRHRKCPYIKLLERMCPIGRTDGDMNSLLPQHNTSHQVYLFTRECLHRVIPNEFWGSSHNRVRFFCCVKRFLSMGKFDRLSLSQLLWKMRVNDCNWLKISKNGRCPPSEHRYRERTLGQFLVWLVDGYVVGLVRAFFYVTESMGQKNALRFYRHPVWRRLQDLAFSNHIFKGQLELLTQKQVAALPKTVGLFRLRYIPKSSGMRPITRMTKMNFQLHNVLQVCVRERPSLLGSTVFGVQDIHRVLGQFSALQKEYPCPLYFVKVDVRGAYDSLPHDKLLQVVSEVLLPMKRKTFFIRSYAHVWADPGGGVKRAFRRQADLQDNARASIRDFVADLQEVGKIRDTILVEQHFSTDVCGKDVFEFFREMLSVGCRIFRQCRGIPQGSVVSMFLCCLCYGHMENSLFRHITEEGGCLMRLVDDFLLITPDQSKAQFFLKTLMAGVPEYGCFANPEKVVVNFAVDDLTNTSGICQLPFHCLFPWCGLLLDTNSLDVYGDYSSYAGLSLRWSLTLGSTPCAGQHMSKKLMALLKLKCQAIFLDLKMNSLPAVYKNIYKIVLLQAYRFHVCARNLPFGQKISKNPQFFQLMIWKMAKKTHLLIRQHNRGDCLDSPCSSGRLQYEAVELMFCISFLATMSHYRHMYKCLIPQLHKRKRKLEGKLGDVRLALVRQASTPQIPDDFQLIRI
uniref:Telomerase reverse transcriptase n=1 Tax=Scleropages formosus TaxID=113540 RepID=A0A8C9VGR4_SCLFO